MSHAPRAPAHIPSWQGPQYLSNAKAPKNHEDSWGLTARLASALYAGPVPDVDYCRIVSQYVEFGPKGPEHPSV
jgi:hypothetical protein